MGSTKNTPTGKIKVMRYESLVGDPEPILARYREGTTDEKALREVVDRQGYRRKSAGFDVEKGESWLDLGGNIGSFAVYYRVKGATCESYEPDEDCFKLLSKNVGPGSNCYRAAVTAEKTPTVSFFQSRDQGNHYRGSILKATGMTPQASVPNLYGGEFIGRKFDGVKLDIEGSEFGLIENWLFPKCDKMVMEYHTSRDRSTANLKKRLDILRSKFHNVVYPPEYDKKIAEGDVVKTFFDRFIYCWGTK